ncbi:MAG: choline/carnitine O-acyltransferase [bacterium]
MSLPDWPLPDYETTHRRVRAALEAIDRPPPPAPLPAPPPPPPLDPDGPAWHARATADLYTAIRGPLPDRNHYWLLLEPDPDAPDLLTRAARLTRALADIAHAVHAGRWPREHLAGQPLEMRQYAEGAFTTAREPDPRRDITRHHPPAEHVAVVCEGHLATLAVRRDGRPLAPAALARALAPLAAPDRPPRRDNAPPAATALPRATWAALRATLDPRALARVDGALFALCLEPATRPCDLAAAAEALRRGDLASRWYDKSLALVVFADGTAGLSCEHAALDGHVALALAHALAPPPATGHPGPAPLTPLTLGEDPAFEARVARALAATDPATIPEGRTHRTPYGRARLTPRGGADALVQLAIARAARAVLGGWPPVNEAVQIRHVRHGRYDTALTTTPEQRRAITRWEATGAPDPADLRAVGAAHRRLIDACRRGESPVLPWLVHAAAAAAAGRPFAPEWLTVLDCPVTTSNAGHSPRVAAFGFTDAEPGTLGVAYLLGDDTLTLHVKADGDRRALLDPFVAALLDGLAALADAPTSPHS